MNKLTEFGTKLSGGDLPPKGVTMTIKYIKKPKSNDFFNASFTYCKEYRVLSDYRLRQSGQQVADNGLVIMDDANSTKMVFLDDFVITNSDTSNTYTFKPREVNQC